MLGTELRSSDGFSDRIGLGTVDLLGLRDGASDGGRVIKTVSSIASKEWANGG